MEEEKKIDLSEYGRNIFLNKDYPAVLDGINLELCSWYAYYSSLMIDLELKEAKFWEEYKDYNNEKPKSDAYVRALWKITKDGHKMIEVERILKTLEKCMSSMRSSIMRSTQELKNLKNEI